MRRDSKPCQDVVKAVTAAVNAPKMMAWRCLLHRVPLAFVIALAMGVSEGHAQPADVSVEIENLYVPANRAEWGPVVIPGGECVRFSQPMLRLMEMGEKARGELQKRINDRQIQNEVVVILGAIGDDTTIPLLIDAYPDYKITNIEHRALQDPDFSDPHVQKIMCFTYALTFLTGEPIGRTRLGADLKPENKRLWSDWWKRQGGKFKVPREKPNETWVPWYPTKTSEERH